MLKKLLGPVHLLTKTDKWDYLWCPIMKKKMFLVLTSGKFLEALGSGIGTCLVFCLSSLFSNIVWMYVTLYIMKLDSAFFLPIQFFYMYLTSIQIQSPAGGLHFFPFILILYSFGNLDISDGYIWAISVIFCTFQI